MQDYKLRWRGKHAAGVALVLSNLAQKCMLGYRPVNNQIISARSQTMTHSVTIIQAYAPTAEAEENVINSFYTDYRTR